MNLTRRQLSERFRVAAMRVRDNLRPWEVGYVRMPDGAVYEISGSRKGARFVGTQIPVGMWRVEDVL